MSYAIKSFSLAIILVFMISGCAKQPDKIAQTKSGLPEVEINTTDIDLVKSTIMDKIYSLGKGYYLVDESNNSLVFQKELTGFKADLAQALTVGPRGERPKIEVKFTISKRKMNTVVYAHIFQIYKSGLGKVDRINGTSNNKNFNDLYNFLKSVKNMFL